MFALKPTTSLISHQGEFVEIFRNKMVMGLFDRPGAGKSLEIMAACCDLLYPGQKGLIVAPPHLIPNWKYEIEKFTDLELGVDVDLYPYTQLGKKLTSFSGYSFVAADEAHYLKNEGAKRTQYFMEYLADNQPDFFIYATGTPVENRIPEIYNFLVMLASYEHVFPKITVKYSTYYEFCERFCYVKSTSYGNGVKYYGMRKENLPELKEYLKPWTIRRSVQNLPGMDNQTVVASYEEGSDLAEAFNDHASDGEIGGVDISAKKEAATAKAPFTAEWAHSELEGGAGPLVIFSDHRDPVSHISAFLSEKGWKVASIMGGDDIKARAQIVTNFQEGRLDVVVCTVGSASTGITLTKSNTVVFNDIPWVPSQLDQARQRVLRIGQDKRCRCVYIVGSKADDQIITMIKAKMKVINATVEA